jgi:hypothetical protein
MEGELGRKWSSESPEELRTADFMTEFRTLYLLNIDQTYSNLSLPAW